MSHISKKKVIYFASFCFITQHDKDFERFYLDIHSSQKLSTTLLSVNCIKKKKKNPQASYSNVRND